MPRSYEEIVRLSESMAESLEADTSEPNVSPFEAAVRAAALRRALAETELGDAVGAARDAGVPWDRIGKAVGTSGEAARQKYRVFHERFAEKVKASTRSTVKDARRSNAAATKDAVKGVRETVTHGRDSSIGTKDADRPVRATK